MAAFSSPWIAIFPIENKWPTLQAGKFCCNVRKIEKSKFTGESTNSFSLFQGNDLKIDMQCSNMRSIFLSPQNEVPAVCCPGGTCRLLRDRRWCRRLQPGLFAGLRDGRRAACCSQPALTSNKFLILAVDLQVVALTCKVSRKVWDSVTFSCWEYCYSWDQSKARWKLRYKGGYKASWHKYPTPGHHPHPPFFSFSIPKSAEKDMGSDGYIWVIVIFLIFNDRAFTVSSYTMEET